MPIGTGGIGSLLGMGASLGSKGTPWGIILPIMISFLQSSGLFGETQGQRRDELSQELMDVTKPEFQYWGQQARTINPVVLKALMSQMGRTANWGWPEGKGMDTGFLEGILGSSGGGGPSGLRRVGM